MSRNMLETATSPYLLQHAANPVHWREWGHASLTEARAQNKPILLSIGYAACHWCHVMAHESFEDPETADLMNALFVNIKVDREERPDIDHIYMTALHAQGQQGGWPLTMFLTPDGKPFWGGTYFPKEAKYGRPSFKDTLAKIAQVFRQNPEGVVRNASALTPKTATVAAVPRLIDDAVLEGAAAQLCEAFDPLNGSFSGAPKFPNAPVLDFLLRAAYRFDRQTYSAPALLTLRRMCNGGIYDHLGGGFARYSVDEVWHVPHFEKMLYDNAQLLELLATAYQLTKDPLFKSRAVETVQWLQLEMAGPSGGFCSSLDADSDGAEGRFYIWLHGDIAALLGPDDAEFFCKVYDVSAAGNWHDEVTGEPVVILDRSQAAEIDGVSEQRLAGLRLKLRYARDARPRPARDDKILADWNGMAIASLVNAAHGLGHPEWIVVAKRAFDFIAASMSKRDGRERSQLSHSWRDGRKLGMAFASDYVFMIRAALALHESSIANGDGGDYIAQAIAWAEILQESHVDKVSGLLTTAGSDAGDVIVHLAPTADDAVPNPHGHYAIGLVALAAHTGNDVWRERADKILAACSGEIARSPYSHCSLLAALDFRTAAVEVAIFGSDAALYEAALSAPFHTRIVIDGQARDGTPPGERLVAHAVACTNGTCSQPIRDAETLRSLLAARREI